MAVKEKTSDQANKQFLVACNDCELERMAGGRKEAKQDADTHQEETGHGLVVVEWPRETVPP